MRWPAMVMTAAGLERRLEAARRQGAQQQREVRLLRCDLLPPGVWISWDGRMAGKPTESGSVTFTVQTRDLAQSDAPIPPEVMGRG